MTRRLLATACAAACAALVFGQDSAPAASEGESGDPSLRPRVKMETTLGDIVIELDATKAPMTVDNFLLYAGSGFYDGTVFHRVIPTFMIQGGGYNEAMEQKTDGLRPPVKNEWTNGLKNKRGTISMARLGNQPHSGTAQFFINVVDNERLDMPGDGAAYCVFGQVVEGMEVVDQIKSVKCVKHEKLPFPQPVTPETPVVIKSVKPITPYDRTKVEALMKDSSERVARYESDPLAFQEELAKDWIAKAEKESGNSVQTSDTGLRWVVMKAGEGATPQTTDTVETHYTGWLLYGNKFDSSVDRGKPFPVRMSGGVIPGWIECLSTMKVGEKRRVFIPPKLGYGERGSPPVIPGNAVLVFDLELMSISQ